MVAPARRGRDRATAVHRRLARRRVHHGDRGGNPVGVRGEERRPALEGRARRPEHALLAAPEGPLRYHRDSRLRPFDRDDLRGEPRRPVRPERDERQAAARLAADAADGSDARARVGRAHAERQGAVPRDGRVLRRSALEGPADPRRSRLARDVRVGQRPDARPERRGRHLRLGRRLGRPEDRQRLGGDRERDRAGRSRRLGVRRRVDRRAHSDAAEAAVLSCARHAAARRLRLRLHADAVPPDRLPAARGGRGEERVAVHLPAGEARDAAAAAADRIPGDPVRAARLGSADADAVRHDDPGLQRLPVGSARVPREQRMPVRARVAPESRLVPQLRPDHRQRHRDGRDRRRQAARVLDRGRDAASRRCPSEARSSHRRSASATTSSRPPGGGASACSEPRRRSSCHPSGGESDRRAAPMASG